MRTRVIALGAAAAVALSGCSMMGGDDEETPDSSQTSSEASAASSGDNSSENGAKQAGIDLENPPKPIAKAVLRPSGGSSDNIESTEIELLELRRDDNVMYAVFRMTGEGRGTEETNANALLGSVFFRPVFLDMENLEKYKHINDLTSSRSASAPLGEPIYVFTAFPLPREGVDSMDLQIADELPTIEDVPMPG